GFPDLAVEVVSPTESAEDLQGKIIDYHTAGTEQVWVVYTSSKSVHVYERDHTESVRVYHQDDILEAPTVFPGLKINIADIFTFE
ncbi:MAG: Uma2 family endonuclease, partial [Phototrophicales bacterium]